MVINYDSIFVIYHALLITLYFLFFILIYLFLFFATFHYYLQDIEVVINYDFPLGVSGVESYVHRIGRTARGNKTGSAYTFFTQRDGKMAGELIQLLARCRQVRYDIVE